MRVLGIDYRLCRFKIKHHISGCDYVLYRESVYNQETENPSLTELIIGKQRNKPTGRVHLHFVKEQTKFENLDD